MPGNPLADKEGNKVDDLRRIGKSCFSLQAVVMDMEWAAKGNIANLGQEGKTGNFLNARQVNCSSWTRTTLRDP